MAEKRGMRNEAHSSLSKTKTEAVFGCSEFGNWELPEAWSLFSPLLGSAPQIVTISQRVNNERKNEGEHSRSIPHSGAVFCLRALLLF